jgi:hypothetical protein
LIQYVEPGGHIGGFDDPDEGDDSIVQTHAHGNRYKLAAAEERTERESAEMLANPPTGPVQIFSSDVHTAAELEALGADNESKKGCALKVVERAESTLFGANTGGN